MGVSSISCGCCGDAADLSNFDRSDVYQFYFSCEIDFVFCFLFLMHWHFIDIITMFCSYFLIQFLACAYGSSQTGTFLVTNNSAPFSCALFINKIYFKEMEGNEFHFIREINPAASSIALYITNYDSINKKTVFSFNL